VADSDAAETVTERHRKYFLNLLCNRMSEMSKLGQGPVVEEIQAEIVDIRAAWLGAVEANDETNIGPATEPLGYFLNLSSTLRDGVTLFADPPHLAEKLALHFKAFRASFLVQQGEMALAMTLAKEVLDSGEAQPLALAHAHMAIGNVAHSRGDFATAHHHYEITRSIREPLDDSLGLALVVISLAALGILSGKLEAARQYARDGFRIARQGGFTLGLVLSRLCAGDIALTEGRLEDAQSNYVGALELDRSASNPQYRAQLLRRAGSLALRMGKRDDAEKYHTEALELFLDLGDQRAQAQAYIDLGDDSVAAEHFGQARERFMRGVRLAIAFASTHLKNLALLGLARAEIGLGNIENAARIARLLAETDVARKETSYGALVDALGADRIEGPPCALDDVLSEIANDADARALML
jgi:tetratricopeptide (TPR) repeat protein